jgi:hypothetical protein
MPILGVVASSTRQGLATNSYESIQTVTVGSGGASTISFTSIPSTYEHLQIRGVSRNNGAGGVSDSYAVATFNSDSGGNYISHSLISYSSTVNEANTGVNQTAMWFTISITGTQSNFAANVIDIFDYKNTNKFKTVRQLGSSDRNTPSGAIALTTGLWRSTATITRIDISLTNNWAEHTTYALYGIKGS